MGTAKELGRARHPPQPPLGPPRAVCYRPSPDRVPGSAGDPGRIWPGLLVVAGGGPSQALSVENGALGFQAWPPCFLPTPAAFS